MGPDPRDEVKPPKLTALLERAKIRYIWRDDPREDIWSKFVFIAAYGLVTACFDKTIGEVLSSEAHKAHVRSVMEEICSIACALEISLPQGIVKESLNKGEKFPFEAKTSFQRDYEITGKPDERDLFGGTILRMGRALGVRTGETEMIYTLLEEKKAFPEN